MSDVPAVAFNLESVPIESEQTAHPEPACRAAPPRWRQPHETRIQGPEIPSVR